MRRYIKAVNELCVGCHSCELACAIEHSEHGDIEQMALHGETPGYRIQILTKNGKPRPLTCRQCEKPACLEACPESAISRVSLSEPVLLNEEKCNGNGRCVDACPFNIMAMKPGENIAMKCDLCIDRQAAGKEPACIEACPTGALRFSDAKVLSEVR
jgi:carbon-monoxide dehydrogenase iron sulfur subunit